MSVRIQRLQSLIHSRIAMVFIRDLNDPRVRLVTVTKVRLAGNLEECKVYWSTLAEGGARTAVACAIDDARGYIQRSVAEILETRTSPHLVFIFDQSIEGAERVSRLIREARAEDDERARLRAENAPPGEAPAAPPDPAITEPRPEPA